LPWIEVLSSRLGCSFPLLLIGHAVTTGSAIRFLLDKASYATVIANLLMAGTGMQLALLAPGLATWLPWPVDYVAAVSCHAAG
jgi:hypothetical protein